MKNPTLIEPKSYNFLSINEFLTNFNDYYNKSIPFIFTIDFDIKHFYLEKLQNLITNDNVLFNFNGITNHSSMFKIDKNLYLKKFPIDYESYLKKFEIVQSHLKQGDSYLLNLTAPTKIETNLSLKEIYLLSNSKYKLYFYGIFTFFSPETFITIEDSIIKTHPMKGTIDSSIPNAKEVLLNDEKELAEHITVVDLLRNDLNMVSKKVTVTNFRYFSEINLNNKKIYQTSTEIVGNIKSSYQKNIAELIIRLLPAGSVTGAPKKKTVDIIKSVETYERFFYTGISGLFDGKILDTCVNIRYIEKTQDDLYYKSGGGITVYSNPINEYNELIEKVYVPISRNYKA
ncbi:para-aminobenzoate synthase component I [Deferribacter desulfuricans SSM1]|uniref:Para-aminobenzoate synthase component I n=1 Tax=Deferribacter desulfuricans (strain DSM 14783 / JCM 11476 / NBRC 101012 / SSM1) TaxID=639282 RepID=D3PDU8_DEFDS|nr:aminodeoxychorismate synthase component I [Deferribacter desulfuricans]BAI80771.1 para-aminobenzoate synthase component I [Deferribacter desulfuricans SSM1]